MKTEIIKWVPTCEFKVGELYQLDDKTTERIVMCTGEAQRDGCFSGTILHDKNQGHVGKHKDTWLKQRFVPFKGLLKLTTYEN